MGISSSRLSSLAARFGSHRDDFKRRCFRASCLRSVRHLRRHQSPSAGPSYAVCTEEVCRVLARGRRCACSSCVVRHVRTLPFNPLNFGRHFPRRYPLYKAARTLQSHSTLLSSHQAVVCIITGLGSWLLPDWWPRLATVHEPPTRDSLVPRPRLNRDTDARNPEVKRQWVGDD